MERTLRIVRCTGAVGFIAARWLLGVCNVAVVCGWLAVASSTFAAVYAAAFLGSAAGVGAVLGRRGARLLALTCALHLAAALLGAMAPGWFAWRTQLVGALDLMAWAWILYAAPAVARRLLGGEPVLQALPRTVGPGRPVVSALIVCVLVLQVSALFKSRPTLWPFIDYPLYSAAQTTAVRAIHYRLYGVSAQGPPAYVEITAEALGMSWFVYHTELIPRLFDRPGSVPAQLRRALEDADLPPFGRIEAERTTVVLTERGTVEFPERRPVWGESTGGDRETPDRGRTAAARAGRCGSVMSNRASSWFAALGDVWVRFWFPTTTAVPLAVCRLVLVPAWLLFFAGSPDGYAVPLAYDPARIDQVLIRIVLLFVPVEVFHTEQFLRGVWLAATVAGVLATVGFFTRTAILTLGLGYWLLIAHLYSYGELHHPEAPYCIRARPAGPVAVGPLLFRRFVARQAIEAPRSLGARRADGYRNVAPAIDPVSVGPRLLLVG